MGYSRRLFGISFTSSVVATAVLVGLILTSQIAMALLPVLGIGGFYMEANFFEGNNGVIYPQKGQDVPTPLGASHGVTDTAACQEHPMLVFDLESATVDGFTVFKDIRIPFSSRWMSIKMDQPNGKIIGNQIKISTTQAWMDRLTIFNVRLREGASSALWGPNSGEFVMKGDPGGRGDPTHPDPDLFADGVQMWVHAVTGDGVTFQGNPVHLELTYPTDTDLENRYSSLNVLAPGGRQRSNYFQCSPP